VALDEYEMGDGNDVIVQAEPAYLSAPVCVPVVVEGPVETRELASRFGTIRAFTLNKAGTGAGTGPAVKVCGHDPRRRVVRLLAYDSTGFCLAVSLGATKNEAELGQPFILPLVKTGTPAVSVQIPFTGTGEIWAIGDTNGGATLSVVSESWI
jgi:hypothetical protein